MFICSGSYLRACWMHVAIIAVNMMSFDLILFTKPISVDGFKYVMFFAAALKSTSIQSAKV